MQIDDSVRINVADKVLCDILEVIDYELWYAISQDVWDTVGPMEQSITNHLNDEY